MHRALVTGVGHRTGIGYACASQIADRGDLVFVTRWDAYDLARPHSHECDVPWPSINIDLQDVAAPKRVFEEAEAQIGAIDILVQNHAFSTRDDIETLESSTLDAHLAVNVRGSLLLCQEFVNRNRSGWGRIVFLTSGQLLHPMPDEISYAASKGAIEAISLALAGGLAQKGILVNAVDPGATDTGWISQDDLTR